MQGKVSRHCFLLRCQLFSDDRLLCGPVIKIFSTRVFFFTIIIVIITVIIRIIVWPQWRDIFYWGQSVEGLRSLSRFGSRSCRLWSTSPPGDHDGEDEENEEEEEEEEKEEKEENEEEEEEKE